LSRRDQRINTSRIATVPSLSIFVVVFIILVIVVVLIVFPPPCKFVEIAKPPPSCYLKFTRLLAFRSNVWRVGIVEM
jgi:hypothetical protein